MLQGALAQGKGIGYMFNIYSRTLIVLGFHGRRHVIREQILLKFIQDNGI